MTLDQKIQHLRHSLEEWPAGATIYHRADGKRGIIVEHCIDEVGCIMINVAFGHNTPWAKCLPSELSTTPVRDDGDEWKDGKEGADA